MSVLFLIFLDQICQKWIELDQTAYSSKNTFVKFEVTFWPDFFLARNCFFQMNPPYLSKH